MGKRFQCEVRAVLQQHLVAPGDLLLPLGNHEISGFAQNLYTGFQGLESLGSQLLFLKHRLGSHKSQRETEGPSCLGYYTCENLDREINLYDNSYFSKGLPEVGHNFFKLNHHDKISSNLARFPFNTTTALICTTSPLLNHFFVAETLKA